MSGLAQILLQRGWTVSGSDVALSAMTRHLATLGARIFTHHAAENIEHPSVVVYSTAIDVKNPEIQKARELGIPLLHRSEMLKTLMEGSLPLLVTGTHGKTSTTALLAHLLIESGQDPSYAIGGVVPSLGGHSHHGKGSYFVAEADESDGSCLKYTPFGAIITNIDNDHLDYWKTEEALLKGLEQFGRTSQKHLFWCGDDPQLRALGLPGTSYGFDPENALQILFAEAVGWGMRFSLDIKGKLYEHIDIPLVGLHHVLNATAVFDMGLELKCSEEQIRAAYRTFHGVNRRLEKKCSFGTVDIYDDYAHHPTEVRVTLDALKKVIGNRPLIVAFQPHRYTRVRDCLSMFASAFESADRLIMTDIYSAGEAPIEGISTERLSEVIQKPLHYVPRSSLAEHLRNELAPFDGHEVLVSMGAGDITRLAEEMRA